MDSHNVLLLGDVQVALAPDDFGWEVAHLVALGDRTAIRSDLAVSNYPQRPLRLRATFK